MAQRRRRDENYNDGTWGISEKALKALDTGTYGQLTNRKAKYTDSGSQRRQSYELPVLDGVLSSTPAPEWNRKFGKSNVDTGRARRNYEQKIGHNAEDFRDLRRNGYESSYNDIDFSGLSNLDKEVLDAALIRRDNEKKIGGMIAPSDEDRIAEAQSYIDKYGRSKEDVLNAYEIYKASKEREARETTPFKAGFKDFKSAPDRGIANAVKYFGQNYLPDSDIEKAGDWLRKFTGAEEVEKQRNYSRESNKIGNFKKAMLDPYFQYGDLASSELAAGLLSGGAMADPASGFGMMFEGNPLLKGAMKYGSGYGLTADEKYNQLVKQGVDEDEAAKLANISGLSMVAAQAAGKLVPTLGATAPLSQRLLTSGGINSTIMAGRQGLEEIADILIRENQSDYNQSVQKHIAEGMTPEQADKTAKAEIYTRVGGAGLFGLLMGAGSEIARNGLSKAASKVADNADDVLNSVWATQPALEGESFPRLTGSVDNTQTLTGSEYNVPALVDNIYPIQMPGTQGVIPMPGTNGVIAPVVGGGSAPKTMNDSTGLTNGVVARLTGEPLKKAQTRLTEISTRLNELKTAIPEQYSKYKEAPKTKRKAEYKKYEDLNKERAKLAYEQYAVGRQVEGLPEVSRQDKDIVTKYIGDLKKVGNMYAGKEGGKLASDAITALQKYEQTGNNRDYFNFVEKVYALENAAVNPYTNKGNGNVSTYNTYYNAENGNLLTGQVLPGNKGEKNPLTFDTLMKMLVPNAPSAPVDAPVEVDPNNVIYHSGILSRLNKADSAGRMEGTRDTGYYGTGHYFVDQAHKNQIGKGTGYGDKPFSSVDISKYDNLFRADTDKKASQLHDFSQKMMRYVNKRNDRYFTENGKVNKESLKEYMNNMYSDYKSLFGKKALSKKKFEARLKQFRDEYEYDFYDRGDSAITTFMKEHGYNGVDTRGTNSANTERGIVIYDLDEDSVLQSNVTDEAIKNGLMNTRVRNGQPVFDEQRDAEIQQKIDSYNKTKQIRNEYRNIYDESRLRTLRNEVVALEEKINNSEGNAIGYYQRILNDDDFVREEAERLNREFNQFGLPGEDVESLIADKRKTASEMLAEMSEDVNKDKATLSELKAQLDAEEKASEAAYKQAKANIESDKIKIQQTGGNIGTGSDPSMPSPNVAESSNKIVPQPAQNVNTAPEATNEPNFTVSDTPSIEDVTKEVALAIAHAEETASDERHFVYEAIAGMINRGEISPVIIRLDKVINRLPEGAEKNNLLIARNELTKLAPQEAQPTPPTNNVPPTPPTGNGAPEDGMKTSKYYKNTMRNTETNQGMTDEEYANRYNEELYKYMTRSEKQSVGMAHDFIKESGGEDFAIARLLSEEFDGEDKFNGIHVDAAHILANKLEKEALELEAQGKDASYQWRMANRLHKKIQENGTIYAQGLQANKKWKKTTSQGALDDLIIDVNRGIDNKKTTGYTRNVNKLSDKVEDAIASTDNKAEQIARIKDVFAQDRENNPYDTKKAEQLVLNLVGGSKNTKKSVSDLIDEASKLIKKEMGVSTLTPKEERAVLNLLDAASELEPGTRAYNVLVSRAMTIVDESLPTTLGEKAKSLLYDNMLASIKTMFTRNFGGNVVGNAIDFMAAPFQVGADAIVGKFTGARTRTLTGKSIVEAAKGMGHGFKDWGQDIGYSIKNKTQFNTPRSGQESLKDVLNAVHKTWKTQSDNKVKKALTNALATYDYVIRKGMEGGDRPIYEAQYAATKAELYDVVDKYGDKGLRMGLPADKQDIDTDDLIEAIAINDALEAVLQNDSKMKEAAKDIKAFFKKSSEDMIGIDIASMSHAPFVEVPANMASNFFKLTPVGWLGNINRARSEKKKYGSINQRRFTGELGLNVLGGLMGVGLFAAADKYISDAYSDKKEEKKLQQNNGYQEYALQTPDESTQIDISDIPYLGAKMKEAKMLRDAYNENGIKGALEEILPATGAATVDSLYQSLNRLTGADFQYNGSGNLLQNAWNNVKSSVGSMGVPSVIRQTAQFTDPYKRDLGDYGTDEYNKNLIINGIPGLRQTMLEPKIDTAGQPVPELGGATGLNRFLSAYVSPWKVSHPHANTSAVQEYANMLKQTTNGAVNPQMKVINKSDLTGIKGYDAENYSHADLRKLQEAYYKSNTELGNALINDSWFTNLSAEKQGELLDQLWSANKALVKENFVREGLTPEQIEAKGEELYTTDNKLAGIIRDDDENHTGLIKWLHDETDRDAMNEKYGTEMSHDNYVKYNEREEGYAEQRASETDKAKALDMSVDSYEKYEAEYPGGAQGYYDDREGARQYGFVNANKVANVDSYRIAKELGDGDPTVIQAYADYKQEGIKSNAYGAKADYLANEDRLTDEQKGMIIVGSQDGSKIGSLSKTAQEVYSIGENNGANGYESVYYYYLLKNLADADGSGRISKDERTTFFANDSQELDSLWNYNQDIYNYLLKNLN